MTLPETELKDLGDLLAGALTEFSATCAECGVTFIVQLTERDEGVKTQ